MSLLRLPSSEHFTWEQAPLNRMRLTFSGTGSVLIWADKLNTSAFFTLCWNVIKMLSSSRFDTKFLNARIQIWGSDAAETVSDKVHACVRRSTVPYLTVSSTLSWVSLVWSQWLQRFRFPVNSRNFIPCHLYLTQVLRRRPEKSSLTMGLSSHFQSEAQRKEWISYLFHFPGLP